MEAKIPSRNFSPTAPLSSKVNRKILGLLSCQCLHVIGFLLMVNPSSTQSKADSQSQINHVSSSFSSFKLHPRILEFHPDYVNGVEGSKIDGLTLKKTIVIVTPGLLIPPDNVEELHPSWSRDRTHLCNFQEFSKNHKSDKVRGYSEILSIKDKFRSKKVKSGLKFFSPLSEAGDCASKKLSAAGVSHLIYLGQYLRQAYSDQLSSLHESAHDLDLAETFGEEALFQSLNALLYGLLTEKQFISTDIAKRSRDFNTASERTPQPHHDLQHFVEQSYETESYLLKNSKIDILDQDVDVPSKHTVLYLLNILFSILNDNNVVSDAVKNSNFFNSRILSYNAMSRLFNTSDIHTSYLSSNSAFKLYAQSRTYNMRQRLKALLPKEGKAVDNDLNVISIDDLLMLSLLVSLNMSVNRHLPSASRLVIEYFETVPSMLINPLWHAYPLHNGEGLQVSPDHSTDQLGSKLPSHIPLGEHPSTPGGIGDSSPPSFPLSHILLNQNMLAGILKQNDIPIRNHQNPFEFVRVLYNGQVITAQLGGCSHDTLITLGLCVRSSFENLLNSLAKSENLKEEL
ncbi:unnamed protein product [Lymnaea stagnalis]|uniref:Uncharacterized protein n=1 Tax=Lymnaea stagnalis TaxID=6523 RepID=A0AAV2IAS3_LYMST